VERGGGDEEGRGGCTPHVHSFKQMGADTDTDAEDLFPHIIKLCPVYQAPLQIHTHPYTNTYIHFYTHTHTHTHTHNEREHEREREREVKQERPSAMLFQAACHLPISPMERERRGETERSVEKGKRKDTHT
jgi:hypothetical protein